MASPSTTELQFPKGSISMIKHLSRAISDSSIEFTMSGGSPSMKSYLLSTTSDPSSEERGLLTTPTSPATSDYGISSEDESLHVAGHAVPSETNKNLT